MANTYTQIYLHFVFAVQNRMSLINPKWQAELYKYMSGIITNNGHKAPSDLMHDVKRSSSLWINDNRLVMGKFSWQEGFGAFSYGKSQIPNIAYYIEQQQEHHKKRTFIEEYVAFLKIFGVEYDERYIYKPID